MLQPTVDLRLEEKSSPALRVAGVPGLDLLQRNLTVDLFIVGDKYFSQATPGVGTKNPIPSRSGGGE
jgi:hypothetical protein